MKEKKIKIEVNNASKLYTNARGEAITALSKTDIAISEGEFICLLGPSGCGKTTLLNMIAGFISPSEGEIIIDGNVVKKPDSSRILIFQDYGLFPWRTVRGNVEFGLEENGTPKEKRAEIADKYIKMVGLSDFANCHPQELSGGMKQRVAIARALAVEPEILFMDEPFAALDMMNRIKMQEEISRIWQETGRTIVFVTHDIDEAVFLADRIVVMASEPGRIAKIVEGPFFRPRHRTNQDFAEKRAEIYEALGLDVRHFMDYAI
ncbi:MAG: ABC transporter ATP-binding protein [Armatimonadota bacterium]